ncbi:toll/interleukin-1 receptor domain-containing protein [Ekhidna sp.]|uniref:toll/interleukin-1 receptor domain-containing protein n=1 Tax=Ekhidna sp. TaxID=2608089 RepID=UPI003C79DA3A
MSKASVFISYSRADTDWLKQVDLYLKQLKHQHEFEFWDDTKIKPGEEWKLKINEYIDNCQVALLLVSANFLASEFINNEEVPEILRKAKKKGVKIFTLVIDICNFDDHSPLYKYHCLNKPDYPIEEMPEIDKKKLLVKMARQIRDALQPSSNDSYIDEKVMSVLVLAALARNRDTEFSIKKLQSELNVVNGLEIRRKHIYSILNMLEKEKFIIKIKKNPTKKEKSSAFWRISQLGFSISSEFTNSYLSISNKTK